MSKLYKLDITQLPEEGRLKAIDALRSGKYVQHRGRMCDPAAPNSACCLHVMAIDIDGLEWSDGIDMAFPSEIDSIADFSEVAEFAKIEFYESGKFHSIIYLSNANDDHKLTFPQIADLLEHGELEVKKL